MTIPDERRRNLTWGRATLEEFSLDIDLRPDWRDAAAALLDSYPSKDFLQLFDAADPAALDAYADTLLKARMLFLRVSTSAECTEQRRYSLRVVLRHFP